MTTGFRSHLLVVFEGFGVKIPKNSGDDNKILKVEGCVNLIPTYLWTSLFSGYIQTLTLWPTVLVTMGKFFL